MSINPSQIPDPTHESQQASEKSRGFRAWPKPTRILSLVAVVIVALGVMTGVGVASYSILIAPPLAKAAAAKCADEYSGSAARTACRAGDDRRATAAQKAFEAQQRKAALVKQCSDAYDDSTAQLDCEQGETTKADADQKAADAAAAAAQKLATEGQSYDNPYPAGTKASMENTNRLDGQVTDFTEWITSFNADWRGYDEFSAPDAGKKYIAFVVHVQATDAGIDAGTIAYDASFTDSKGNVYDQADVEYEVSGRMPQVTLGAGQQASGVVIFEVPVSVTSGVATFGDGTVFEALR